MSLFYKITHWAGFKPWEKMAALPIAGQISTLFEREENERQPPYGAALDLGCGSGIWSVKLAERGWDVTGVDIVSNALQLAHKRALNAGVKVNFIHGDITALRDYGVGHGFRFVLDFGAIHGLTPAQREAVGREVSAVAAAKATMLILAWAPGRRGPLPHGLSRQDIQAVFPAWTIIDEEAANMSGAPGFVKRTTPRFYRLRLT
jgi:SAM-dependent methyltransferase